MMGYKEKYSMTDYKPQPKLGDFFKIIIFLITFYYTLEVCPKFS